MPDGKTGRSLHADVERIFSHDCSGKEGESGLPEKSVSVTLQKTCDGVFIKKNEYDKIAGVLFEKQTENCYDKKKRRYLYTVGNGR